MTPPQTYPSPQSDFEIQATTRNDTKGGNPWTCDLHGQVFGFTEMGIGKNLHVENSQAVLKSEEERQLYSIFLAHKHLKKKIWNLPHNSKKNSVLYPRSLGFQAKTNPPGGLLSGGYIFLRGFG